MGRIANAEESHNRKPQRGSLFGAVAVDSAQPVDERLPPSIPGVRRYSLWSARPSLEFRFRRSLGELYREIPRADDPASMAQCGLQVSRNGSRRIDLNAGGDVVIGGNGPRTAMLGLPHT